MSALNAISELHDKTSKQAESLQKEIEILRIERDRYLIQSNKWRYKFEAEASFNQKTHEDFFGDSDYLNY